jgi:CRISPR-associated protein Cas5h
MARDNLNTELEKVLIFDVKGPLAHFRKYYTNSSSLSYLFPPRTVVTGLLAGLLGLPSERHTNDRTNVYYEKFDEKRCLVAVSLRSKVRRIMQTVNYIRTKSLSEVDGSAGGTQIRLEILLPENGNDITYRVYFYHEDMGLYDELKKRLEAQKFVFPPYMGIAEFLASVEYIGEGEVSKNPNREVELNSVSKLKEIELDFGGKDLQYITEKMPTGFLNDRTPRKPEEYVLEVKGKLMKVKLKDNTTCYSVSYSEDCCRLIENIMFM